VHRVVGKIAKKLAPAVCSFCPYDHKNLSKVEAHAMKCSKKFQLASNLQPLPSDCDIPIKFKPTVWMRPQVDSAGHIDTSQSAVHRMQSNDQMRNQMRPGMSQQQQGAQSSVMEIGGQLYSWGNQGGKPLLTSLRSQGGGAVANGPSSVASSSLGTRPNMMAGGPRGSVAAGATQVRQVHETCEICGMIVDSPQSLWNHLQTAHKVEFRTTVMEQEPCIVCDMCKAKFWTYQGLARHSLLLHKRNISGPGGAGGGSITGSSGGTTASSQSSFRCHICGASQTANPLNHLSTHHNITLLDMYHSRQCCMCNRKLRTGRAFEEHMVLEHRDIFANQDVLRTVLQALSTALYLKTEDVQQNNARSPQANAMIRMQNFNAGTGFVPGMVRQRAPFGPHSQNSSFVDSMLRQRSPMMMNQQGSFAQKSKQKSSPVVKPPPAAPVAVVKTPDKKTLEEEAKVLNKLYEDYADIGRPISRSMKHKLLLSPSANSAAKKVDSEKTGNSSEIDRASLPDGKTDELSAGSADGGTTDRQAASSNSDNIRDADDEPESKKPRLSGSLTDNNDANRSEEGEESERTVSVAETAS
jgi:hypothetical protein